MVQRALGRLCKSAGYDVGLYESAESFLDAGCAAEIDCLILDVHLPGRSGLQLQAELNTADMTLPIIFLTGEDNEKAREQAIENGAFDFLLKTQDGDRLLDVIRRAIVRGA